MDERLVRENSYLLQTLFAMGARLDGALKLLATISKLTTVPLSCKTLKTAANEVLETLVQGLDDIDSCSLLLFDLENGCLVLLGAKGQEDFLGLKEGNHNSNLSFKPGEGVAGRVFVGNQPCFWDITSMEADWIKQGEDLKTPESLACLPLTVPEQTIGVLNISFFTAKPFDEARKRELILLSGVVANLIQTFILRMEVEHKAESLRNMVAECRKEISERKAAQIELKRTQQQLTQAQKMEAIGTLASGIAHDFNNILQGISGYVQLLLSEKNPGHRDRRKLDEIDQAAQRGAELVRRLLTFGRRMDVDAVELNVPKEIGRVLGLFGRVLPKMITLEVDFQEPLWAVVADSVQFEQIVMNLTLNAAEALGDRGTIHIRAENVVLEHDEARLLEVPPGPFLKLTVQDDGPGMTEEIKARIFEPFFTTKEIGKGTGLGLATVYGIARRHNGAVACISAPAQGAVFEVFLPAVPLRSPEQGRMELVTKPLTGHETVLLVDDDHAVLEVAQELLAEHGYQVLTAERGEAAVEIYREKGRDIGLVILDLGMPGMGGLECLKELRKLNSDVKVMIASGYTMEEPVRQSLEAGAVDFITKPYRLREMLGRVREALG